MLDYRYSYLRPMLATYNYLYSHTNGSPLRWTHNGPKRGINSQTLPAVTLLYTDVLATEIAFLIL